MALVKVAQFEGIRMSVNPLVGSRGTLCVLVEP